MDVTWLGWAGIALRAEDGSTLVVDPLADPFATFAPYGEPAREVPLPPVAPPTDGAAIAGLVTHLHRDHADAPALAAALAPGAPLLGPHAGGGEPLDELALAQATAELTRAGLMLRETEPWSTQEIGPFTVTALPAVDGTGDPQVSWLIEADGRRVAHFGDTLLHGFWWRITHRYGPIDVAFVPVNGATVEFPHRRPPSGLPAVMDPRQAAAAVAALGAGLAVPMHFGGYDFDPYYRPVHDAAAAFVAAAGERGVTARELAVGETLALG